MNPMNRRGFVAAAAGAAAATVPLNAQAAEASPGRGPSGTPTPTHTGDLPYDDRTDFADADRGFVAAYTGGLITTPSGGTAWDPDAYRFLTDAAETAPT
ncbi:MBL fold metallo-hydrolase, partial [Streptomyces venezuelae]